MSKRVVAFVFITASLGLGAFACGSDTQSTGIITPGTIVNLPGIEITVRNEQGMGVAQGTSAVVAGLADSASRSFVEDSVRVGIYVNPGTYAVRLSKALYRDTTLTNIVVQGGNFGTVHTTKLSVTMHPAPSTATVRSLAVFGAAFLDQPGATARLFAVVDASAGVRRAVRWSIDDGALASIDQDGVVVAKCSTRGGTVTATAHPIADGAVFSSVRMAVAPAPSC